MAGSNILSIDIDLKDTKGAKGIKRRIIKAHNSTSVQAAKRALKRGIKKAGVLGAKTAQEQRNLSLAKIKEFQFEQRQNLKSKNIDDLSVTLGIMDKDWPLIEFVKGSKKPRKVRVKFKDGKVINKTRKIKVMIKTGIEKTISAFIADSDKFGFQIFRRKTKERHPLARQVVPSLHHWFAKRKNQKKIIKETQKFIRKTYKHDYKFLFKKRLKKIRG